MNNYTEREFYSGRSLWGYWWAIYYFLIGGREAGKSYDVANFFCNQWRKYKRPFYWLRLTAISASKLLNNNAEKLIDPDLRRKYNLDLNVKGDGVYEVLDRDAKGKPTKEALMARVLNLSTFYNDKGSGLFDKDFLNDPDMYYNICLDEMNREASEKNSFDIVYAFANQVENIVRSTKTRVRIICIGNTLAEACDILGAFNFIPQEFGRFKIVKNKKLLKEFIKLKNIPFKFRTQEQNARIKVLNKVNYGKRAVIDYIQPTEIYEERRRGTAADILIGNNSTFTNKVEIDSKLVIKKRLNKPIKVIMFAKDIKFTIWDDNIVAPYNNEKVTAVAMRPYLDKNFNEENQRNIIELFDAEMFRFKNLATQVQFRNQLKLLKPRNG